MIKKNVLNIAIVGFGNIGSYFYRHLVMNMNSIQKKTNSKFTIKYISAKNKQKKRKIKIPKNKWFSDISKIPKLKDVHIVIELIGGSDGVAKKLVFDSIKNKKHVLTANKSLISKYGDEL